MKEIFRIRRSLELIDFNLSLAKRNIKVGNYKMAKGLLQETIESCQACILSIGCHESIIERERYMSRIAEQYTKKKRNKNGRTQTILNEHKND